MKLLFILELFYPNIGGNEKLFLGIGEALVKHGHEVTVVTSRFQKELPAKEFLNGIRIIRIPLRNRFIFTFFGLFWVFKYAAAADLIHTTSYNAAVPAWLAGKLRKKPVIITFHEVWGKLWFRLPFLTVPERLMFFIYEQFILHLDFAGFIAVSDYTRECLLRNHVKSSRISMIYNGLEPGEYMAPPPVKHEIPSFTYAYFGRLGPSKGIDILMEASVRFLREGNRKLILIASRKPSRIQRYVSAQIRKHGLQDWVEWMDHLPADRLKKVLEGVDCIVIPSSSEGFCFVAAEAAAMQVPMIASRQGALPEVVSGKHLFMKDLEAGALREALEKAEKGEWEQKPLRPFLLSDCLGQHLRLYSSLVVDSPA